MPAAGVFAEGVEEVGADIEGQAGIGLSLRPAGAVETSRRHEHHIAHVGGHQSDILDQVIALAFQDEPELIIADVKMLNERQEKVEFILQKLDMRLLMLENK